MDDKLHEGRARFLAELAAKGIDDPAKRVNAEGMDGKYVLIKKGDMVLEVRLTAVPIWERRGWSRF